MNSATDTIRAMLDELGVEWETNDRYTARWLTRWKSNGIEWSAEEEGMALLLKTVDGIEPEQAIEATLGRGECEKLPSDGITRCFVRRYGYEREFGYWKCSACGCECFEGARYCMGCGRKVKA